MAIRLCESAPQRAEFPPIWAGRVVRSVSLAVGALIALAICESAKAPEQMLAEWNAGVLRGLAWALKSKAR